MPQARRAEPANPGGSDVNNQVEAGGADPKDVLKIQKSIASREQAPTAAEQTPQFTDWQRARDELGPPFDSEHITLKQMRQLRKDPMIAFGLHYRKVPMVNGEWHIEARDRNGPNAQVAGFIDAALREIYARLLFQRTLAYDFGFNSSVKRFKLEAPAAVYSDWTDLDPDTGEPKVKPVWDEGTVLPWIWKAPVGLRPERVQPVFDDKTGEFNGMLYDVPPAQRGKQQGFASRGKAKNQAQREIDVYHSYWGTHNKDDEHGSVYGYPLTGLAREYWWTYKFLFHTSNRAFERLAIPPVLAYHPEGNTVVDEETGETRPNWEIALEMAERLRLNAVAAVPSTMADKGMGELSATIREWDFKFMETPTEALSVFDARFNYLNVMKLRSIWIPDMAFMGNEQGNSGGNIAEQMAEVLIESLALDMNIIDDEINRYWIPQLLIVNFPEFINNGGKAWKVSHGFRNEDIEFYKQVLQLVGQSNPDVIEKVDLEEIFKRMNAPLKSAAQFAAERQRIAEQATLPPNVTPVGGQGVGVIQNPDVNTGFTNGGSAPGVSAVAGFSQPYIYVQPNEVVGFGDMLEMSDTEDFLTSLPVSKHYTDKTLRALSVQMRRLWLAHYKRLYPEIARHIAGTKTLEFSADDNGHNILWNQEGIYELADKQRKPLRIITKKAAERAAKKLLDSWEMDSKTLNDLGERSGKLMRKMLDRAVKLDLRRNNLQADITDDVFDDYISEQVARLIRFTHRTVRDEVQDFVVERIRNGKSTDDISTEMTTHYDSMPLSKSDRVARSETRDAVNAATLLSGEAAGLRYVRMTDGEKFDQDCKDRNGKLATIKEAWRELRKEHPYGTLGFDLIPRAEFSIQYVNEMPEEAPEETTAWFDDNDSTAYIIFGEDGSEEYLTALADWLVAA